MNEIELAIKELERASSLIRELFNIEEGESEQVKEIIYSSKVVNGVLLHQIPNGLWVNSEGDSGYHSRLTGAWVCYNCGNLCECGE